MGLSARELPNADGQIAWQNIERRALDLHAAGIEGTAGQLQVRAMLDFLLGRAAPAQPGACQDAQCDEDAGACQDAHCDEDGGARSPRSGSCPGTPPRAGRPGLPSCPGTGSSTRTTRWTCSVPPGSTRPA